MKRLVGTICSLVINGVAMDSPYCLPTLYVNQRYCGAAIFKLVCSNIFIRAVYNFND